MLLHQMFVRTAKKQGNKLAIIDETLGRELTYTQTLMGALILAGKFSQYKRSFIGIMLPTSAGCILSIMGSLMAGKIPVMINYSTSAADNAEYAQKKCYFKTIITSRKLLERIRCPLVEGMVFLEDILENVTILDKALALIKANLPTNLLLSRIHKGKENDDALILFTSGSEKDPKAVELTHKNIFSNVIGCNKTYGFKKNDIALSILPYFHVYGQTTMLWIPIYEGLTIITYANPLEFKTIVRIIKERKPTIMGGTPSFYMGYYKQSKPRDFDSLRLVIVGADKSPDWLREGYQKKHNIIMYEGYGTTETSPVISANSPKYYRPGSAGKLFPGVQVKITDVVTGEELPQGKEGKIIVKGDLVMKGYFDDIEETALRIENGWYETGDMGLFDEDGFLWHRGRLKRFAKIGGEMVSLVLVESTIEKLLPAETECCVVEVPHVLKGAKLIVGVTSQINRKEILEKLMNLLPRIAIPKTFIVMNELPKMPSGKIDFRVTTDLLRKQLVQKEDEEEEVNTKEEGEKTV